MHPMSNVSEFPAWLEGELKARDWRQADLIKRSGINSGLLSQILSGQRRPGVETCKAIAKAFGMTDIQVLDIAGLATDTDRPKFNPIVEAAAAMLNDLSIEDQEEIRAMIRVKWERKQRKALAKKHE
jgi:transcriptional regulator with XRE-family HTH domain